MSVPQTTARPAPGPVRAEAFGAAPGFEIGHAIAPATARRGRLGTRACGMAALPPRACSRRSRLPGKTPGAAPRPDFDPAPSDGEPPRLRREIGRHAVANASFAPLAPAPAFPASRAAHRAGGRCAQVCAPRAMIHSSPAAGLARRATRFLAGARRGQFAQRAPVPQQAILDVSLDPARLAAMPVNEYVDLYVIQPSDTGLLSSP